MILETTAREEPGSETVAGGGDTRGPLLLNDGCTPTASTPGGDFDAANQHHRLAPVLPDRREGNESFSILRIVALRRLTLPAVSRSLSPVGEPGGPKPVES